MAAWLQALSVSDTPDCIVLCPQRRQEPESDLVFIGDQVTRSLWLTAMLVLPVLLLCTGRSMLLPAQTWGFCPAVFCSLCQIAWALTTISLWMNLGLYQRIVIDVYEKSCVMAGVQAIL